MQLEILGINLNQINFFPKTIVEEIIQNIKIILTTIIGTVPLDRNLGMDISIIDSPINVARYKAMIYIFETIQSYEPRVEVTQLDFVSDSNGSLEGKLYPKVKVRIKDEFIK